MAKIDCSVTVNFLKEIDRLCCTNRYDCDVCPLFECKNGEKHICECIYDTPEIVEIVQKWSDEHPVKTRLDDLLEKYPNVPLNGAGTPRFDPWMLGYCDKCSDCPNCIGDEYCWHEPVDGGATGKAVE